MKTAGGVVVAEVLAFFLFLFSTSCLMFFFPCLSRKKTGSVLKVPGTPSLGVFSCLFSKAGGLVPRTPSKFINFTRLSVSLFVWWVVGRRGECRRSVLRTTTGTGGDRR